MKRRNLLKGLLGSLVAPMPTFTPAPEIIRVVVPLPLDHITVDLRAVLMENALKDIQAEEDRLFIESVDRTANNIVDAINYEPCEKWKIKFSPTTFSKSDTSLNVTT